jgi:hypothetical protein
MSNIAHGPGWWLASDGRWYPPEQHPSFRAPPPPYGSVSTPPPTYRDAPRKRKKSALRWPVRILLALLLAVAGVIGGIAIQKDRTNSASVSSGIPGTTMTISELDASVQSAITSTQPGNFGIKGISRVVCNPPSTWGPGKSLQCFVYQSSGTELGEYDATILPNDSSGTPQWNGTYQPAG